MDNVVNLGPRTRSLKKQACWHDDYPACQHYADECESLLAFVHDHGALGRFWPRLRSKERHLHKALNEIRVAYSLQSVGYPVIDWEPEDGPHYKVECAVSLAVGVNAFVEVKSPGWELELTKEEFARGRDKQAKYCENIDGRPARPIEVIRWAVEKARPKFSGSVPSILVISDDSFVSLGEYGLWPLQMALLHKSDSGVDGLFHSPDYSTIGAVCLFWHVLALPEPRIEYNWLCLANPNAAPKAAVPSQVATRLSARSISAYA